MFQQSHELEADPPSEFHAHRGAAGAPQAAATPHARTFQNPHPPRERPRALHSTNRPNNVLAALDEVADVARTDTCGALPGGEQTPTESRGNICGKRPACNQTVAIEADTQPEDLSSKRPRKDEAPTHCHDSQAAGVAIAKPVFALPTLDDSEGHLVYRLGDGLYPTADFPQGRYKILCDLGEGTFGKVVECWDRKSGVRVAVKIVRSVTKYRDAARVEIDVLEHLEANDPHGWYHCVRFMGWFDYVGHVCLVFEKLGPSLYDHLRRNRFRPFTLDQVREFAYQLLESVSFVHSLTLIHTDLKPENILLADPDAATAGPPKGDDTRQQHLVGHGNVVLGQDAADGTNESNQGLEIGAAFQTKPRRRQRNQLSRCEESEPLGIRAPRDTEHACSADCSGITASASQSTLRARAYDVKAQDECDTFLDTSIKLIDFGSATFEAQHHSAVISTRHYRAPEVILGMGWTYPCDLWSIGCILVELYTGQALFQTHENLEHLAMMHVVLGPIPQSMIRRADQYSQKYFAQKPDTATLPLPPPSDRPPSIAASKDKDMENDSAARPVKSSTRSRRKSEKNRRRSAYKLQAGHADLQDVHESAGLSRNAAIPVSMLVQEHDKSSTRSAGPSCSVSTANVSSGRRKALNWPAGASSVASVRAVKRMKTLADTVKCPDEHSNFLDLLRRLLAFEPHARCTSAEALTHPFFHEAQTDSDTFDPQHPYSSAPTLSSGGESSMCASHPSTSGPTGLGRGGTRKPRRKAGEKDSNQVSALSPYDACTKVTGSKPSSRRIPAERVPQSDESPEHHDGDAHDSLALGTPFQSDTETAKNAAETEIDETSAGAASTSVVVPTRTHLCERHLGAIDAMPPLGLGRVIREARRTDKVETNSGRLSEAPEAVDPTVPWEPQDSIQPDAKLPVEPQLIAASGFICRGGEAGASHQGGYRPVESGAPTSRSATRPVGQQDRHDSYLENGTEAETTSAELHTGGELSDVTLGTFAHTHRLNEPPWRPFRDAARPC